MLGLLFSLLTGCSRYYQGPVSDHFDGTRFYNPGSPMNKGFPEFVRWRLTAEKQPWPSYSELEQYDKPPDRVLGSDLRVSFVGQSSVLIQTGGLNILTDPLWSKRISPVSWVEPERVHPPGIRFDDLPDIDVVLISHNHYDHLDLVTLERLWKRYAPRIIVPLGNDGIIRSYQKDIQVESYDWGDRVEFSSEVSCHLLQMHHWSARGLFDRNKALWAAFVVSGPGGNVYFAGDTGYGDGEHFRAAKQAFSSFRLAILPIGAYDPRWFMAYGHMNPEEALQALTDLGSPMMLPIHYRTVQLADTGYDRPLKDLYQAKENLEVDEKRILFLKPGEYRMIDAGEKQEEKKKAAE